MFAAPEKFSSGSTKAPIPVVHLHIFLTESTIFSRLSLSHVVLFFNSAHMAVVSTLSPILVYLVAYTGL